MSTGNGAGIPTAEARPMMLLRYRPGLTGQTARTVHLVPLPVPVGGQVGAAGIALCGALLCPDQVETVTPGHGVPCSLCVISHVSASSPFSAKDTASRRSWPTPTPPEHRVLLAGEPYGVDLPWPPGVHRVIEALPLPPARTPRGPVTWVHPPQPDALRQCREIDVFAALRTALRHPPPTDPPPDGGPP